MILKVSIPAPNRKQLNQKRNMSFEIKCLFRMGMPLEYPKFNLNAIGLKA
jgi:hypothetical protein